MTINTINPIVTAKHLAGYANKICEA